MMAIRTGVRWNLSVVLICIREMEFKKDAQTIVNLQQLNYTVK
jgi:hypothetical protein